MPSHWSLDENFTLVNAIKVHARNWQAIETLLDGRTSVACRNHAYELKLFSWQPAHDAALLKFLISSLNVPERDKTTNWCPDWDEIAGEVGHDSYHCQMRAYLRCWVDSRFFPLPIVTNVSRPPPALVLPLLAVLPVADNLAVPDVPSPEDVIPLQAVLPDAEVLPLQALTATPHNPSPHASPQNAGPNVIQLFNDAAQTALSAAKHAGLAKDLANQAATNTASAGLAKALSESVVQALAVVISEAEKARELVTQAANLL